MGANSPTRRRPHYSICFPGKPRPRPRAFVALLALILSGPTPLHATLTWEQVRLERTVRPLQTDLEVAFAFRNTGAAPITIRAVQTNCDCLAAQARPAMVAPGESGIIHARFAAGERTGRHEQVITVATDDGDPPRKLVLQVEVPAPATISPPTLIWAQGAEPTAQETLVEVAPGLDLRFDRFESTSDAFSVELLTDEPGRSYRLRVSPRSTSHPANAALRLHATTANGRAVVVSAYADVR